MIKLYQFPSAFGVPNFSPFCMKVETWLRLAGLEYTVRPQSDPRKSPLYKLPFINDNGTVVTDSGSIIAHLSRTYNVDLDEGLSAEQRATALAFDRMLGEHTYWGLIFARWIEPAGWEQMRPVLFGPIAAVLRPLVAGLIRRKYRRTLWLQGLGRHAHDEIYRRMDQDISALSAYLGTKPFFMGERPSNLDATVYAFLANFWEVNIDTRLKQLVAQHANLVAYCQRMRERCFPSNRSVPDRPPEAMSQSAGA